MVSLDVSSSKNPKVLFKAGPSFEAKAILETSFIPFKELAELDHYRVNDYHLHLSKRKPRSSEIRSYILMLKSHLWYGVHLRLDVLLSVC